MAFIEIRKGETVVYTGKTNATQDFLEVEDETVFPFYTVKVAGRVVLRIFTHERRIELPWFPKASPATALTRL
jgi:hypothetical protein